MSIQLTTLAKVHALAGIPTATTTWDTILSTLINQTADQIEKACDRTFTLGDYVLWLDGPDDGQILLPHWPINSIYGAFINTNNAFLVKYGGTAAFATCSFDGVNMTLLLNDAGTSASTVLPCATYKTVTTMMNAIAAQPDWTVQQLSAGVPNIMGFPSILIRPMQGVWCANNRIAYIEVPIWTEAIRVRQSTQSVRGIETQEITNFTGGRSNVCIWYNAGYTMPTDSVAGNLPDGLMLAAAQIVVDTFNSSKRDNSLKSETLADYSWTAADVRYAIKSHWADLVPYARITL